MREYPKPIQTVVNAFTYLPGVGPKTALRFVFYLLKQPKGTIEGMIRALQELQSSIQSCTICKTYTTSEMCETCLDPRRDKTIICVVAQPRDIGTIDAAGFNGRYHVLGGTLSPIEGITPDTLEIASLLERLNDEPAVAELVLAFNPDIEGESTIMYLSKVLKDRPLRLTRLARGLPVGSDLEFADEVTLGDALRRRWDI
ncbi:recombination protein RecR [Candidatus Uhrbacteria bacterium CG10_big_fil_rev_8_21_14_0_10_50_16]|uniref:Recombination protein RecR n=1 Tax=Candidatus Uhrbacteria bacterium CG10_big_fil_rev_8_21_14_0_10_50_16 TaxID=1975039 RepID=A0A2H0RP61_9BACT|nr:MAG: recombination protein RecR [Candidatus Uhrbacteria bacterium CG10_big_fil_rev_8_21_14_0_10_50_16]